MASSARLPSRIRFGAFDLNVSTGELHKSGIPIKLRLQAAEVLLMLTERSGQVVTRDEIRHRLWSKDTFVDFERSINFCINQIRAALGDDAERPRYVETLPRRGYRFIASVIREDCGSPILTTPVSPVPIRSGAGNSEAPVSRIGEVPPPQVSVAWWKRRKFIGIGTVATLSLAAGLAAFRWPTHEKWPSLQDMRITKLTESGLVGEVAISPDGRYVTYSQQEGAKEGLWLSSVATRSNIQILPTSDTDFVGMTFSPDGDHIYFVRSTSNDLEYHELFSVPALGGPETKLLTDIDSPVSFSPDGSQFAYVRGVPKRNSVELRIANSDGSRGRVLLEMIGASVAYTPGPSWSPDGRSIAVGFLLSGTRNRLVLDIVSLADGHMQELYAGARGIGRPRWLPGGDGLLVELNPGNGRQLWTISYPRGEARQLTNDLANYGGRIDATPDAKSIAAVQHNLISNLWSFPAAQISAGRQITSGQPIIGVLTSSDGTLLAEDNEGKLWSLDANGNRRSQLAEEANWPIACGSYIVYASGRDGVNRLVRMNSDGSDATTLATGTLWAPACTPDGKSIFYAEAQQPRWKIRQVPIDGGAPVDVAENPGESIPGRVTISPDGTLFAFPFDEYTPEPVTKLAIVPIAGGPPLKTIKVPARINGPRWSIDGKSLQYLLTQGKATNLWEQPVAGGKPRQLTAFASGEIFDFNWSLDGKQLFLSRGEVMSDVVLLRTIH